MRPTITAIILAIAASLAAGDNDSHLSSKSSKSSHGCSSCSLDAIGRAQALTDVAYGMFATDGEFTLDTLTAFCASEARQQVFFDAADEIAGCLIYPTCFVGIVFGLLAPGSPIESIPEGDFLALAIENMCEADRTGVTQPEGGCGGVTIELFCSQLPPRS